MLELVILDKDLFVFVHVCICDHVESRVAFDRVPAEIGLARVILGEKKVSGWIFLFFFCLFWVASLLMSENNGLTQVAKGSLQLLLMTRA